MKSSPFSYLSKKIADAEFIPHPFKHLTVERFLSEDHFQKIVDSRSIRIEKQVSNRGLLDTLLDRGYEAQEFPGCISDIDAYVAFADGVSKFDRRLIEGYGRDVIEGYGITMRLKRYDDGFLEELVNYLNEEEFQSVLREKFSLRGELQIETAIQKNLNHYEISPHCDTSRKALTYMVNIYTNADAEKLSIHTHLLRFKPRYQYLYEVWANNKDIDPVWVPWDWCTTVKTTCLNNSVTVFEPSHDTLHAVKLSYDHLSFQRNQIYGNLWYPKPKASQSVSWQRLDIVNTPVEQGFAYHALGLARSLKQSLLDRNAFKGMKPKQPVVKVD